MGSVTSSGFSGSVPGHGVADVKQAVKLGFNLPGMACAGAGALI